MRSQTLGALSSYTDGCKDIAFELEQVLSDARLEASGKKVYFAVDFSEVFAYALPKHAPSEVSLPDRFRDDHPTSWLLQDYTLSRIFFDIPDGLVFLTPYAIELEAFLVQVKLGAFENYANDWSVAGDEIRNILGTTEGQALLSLGARLLEDDIKLSSHEAQSVTNFFEKNATALVSILDQEPIQPVRRIDNLLKAAGLINLNDLVDVFVDHENPTFIRWYKALSARRNRKNEGSNFLDAMAVALVHKANELLLSRDQGRLCLISRSKSMYSCFEEDLAAGHWRLIGNVLRHPRCFSNYHRPEGLNGSELERYLITRRSGLNLFLASASSLFQTRTGQRKIERDSEALSSLDYMLRTIEEEWRASEALAVSTSQSAKSSGESGERVVRLLTALLKSEELTHEIEERIDELATNLDWDHALLGWLLQSGTENERQIVEDSLWYHKIRGNAVLESDFIPYTLQFNSPELFEMTRTQNRWGMSWEVALKFFREGVRSGDTYERLLAMAYTLGSLGRWSLAEKYCEKAVIDADNNITGIFCHEALFFLAYCKRKARLSVDRIQEALRVLERAIETNARFRKEPNYEDPRYIKEKAAQLVEWFLKAKGNEGWDSENLPGIGEIDTLLRHALHLSRSDPFLQLQVINNICFFYSHLDDEDHKEIARIVLKELLELLDHIHLKEAQWPASIVDTVIWAKFKLGMIDSEQLFKENESHLKTILRRRLSREDRREIEGHLHQIQAAEVERASQGSLSVEEEPPRAG